MKPARFLKRLGIALLLASIGTATDSSASHFSTSDLSGTWHVFSFFDHPLVNNPIWTRGTVTFNISGIVTGGNLTDSDGFSAAVTGGSGVLSNSGVLSGSIITSGGAIFTISQGKMDDAKSTMAHVGIHSQGFRFTGTAIKAGGSFTTADLIGTWHVFTYFDHPLVNNPVWTRGTVTINASGLVTGGNLTDSDGFSAAVTSGFLILNDSGVLSGSISAGGITSTIIQGKADPAKTTAAFVGIDSQGFYFMGAAIKAGGGFITADIAGTWHYFTLSDFPFINDPGWERGTVTIDFNGAVTSGSGVSSDGTSATVIGGFLSLNSSGVLSGSINYSNGVVSTITQGKVNASKTSGSYVGVNSAGLVFMGTAIKAETSTTLAAAVLPSSRSVQVGTTATAFATIVNGGSNTATSCGMTLLTSLSATFSYQTTNPATNQVIGSPNTPVNIAPGAAQSFVLALTPSAPLAPTDVQFSFSCTNSSAAPINSGLNTLLFSASTTPVPDIVALAATTSGDGIANIPGASGAGAFAVATVNLGATGSITASADTGAATLPVAISLCETNPATGQCISAIGSSVTKTINASATPTYGIFVNGTGNVAFNPATNRVFVRFQDSGGVTRGSTSVAVRTQ